jgi:hypothetical protein
MGTRVRPRAREGMSVERVAPARSFVVTSVDDDAHLMAARHLTAGEIDHVSEQAADGCAQNMQDFERPARSRHGPKASVRRPESCRQGAPSNRAER